MSTTDTSNITGPAPVPDNYLTYSRGIWSWLFTLDHKRIGLMYLMSVLGAFFIGGIMALLVRTQLLVPEGLIMDQDQYNQVFTLHGAIMVFLVIIPSIPGALGNFILPVMLGAKERSPSDWRSSHAAWTSSRRSPPGRGVSETRMVSPMPSSSRTPIAAADHT